MTIDRPRSGSLDVYFGKCADNFAAGTSSTLPLDSSKKIADDISFYNADTVNNTTYNEELGLVTVSEPGAYLIAFTDFKKEQISLFTAVGLNGYTNQKLKANTIYKLLQLGSENIDFEKSREVIYRFKDRMIVKTLFKFSETQFSDVTRCVVNNEIKPFSTKMFEVISNSVRNSKIVFRIYPQTYLIKSSKALVYAPQIKAVQCIFGAAINKKPEEEIILISLD
jgi:hypothetical protein